MLGANKLAENYAVFALAAWDLFGFGKALCMLASLTLHANLVQIVYARIFF